MYNILFISTDFNYFINNNASFSRMYNNLIYFHNHKDFNVLTLQPNREQKNENKDLKVDILTYYFKEIRFLRNNFVQFIDFNPFYLLKILKILKKHPVDLIHIDYVYGINSLRLITKIPISYNAYNVECIYANQVGKFFSKLPFFLRRLYSKYIYFLEKYAIKFVKSVNAVSLFDKKKLNEIYKITNEKIIVNPFGYQKEIFNNPITQEESRNRLKIDKDKFIVIFHGSYFANYANREAINIIKDDIVTQIKDKDILFLIAGKMPPFKNKINIKFLGYVEDLRDFLYAADVAVVPILRGSGVKTKIIDYLSANIPIITTRKGAEGLILKDDVHGYIIDNPVDDIKKKILELKNNPEKIKKLKNNIKKLITKKYEWNNILKEVAKRYKYIIETNQ